MNLPHRIRWCPDESRERAITTSAAIRYAYWLLLALPLTGCSAITAWLKPSEPRQAPAVATPAEVAARAEPATPRAPRKEKAAIAAAQWQATVEFGKPERIESEAPKIMQDSIAAGAVIGGLPLIACAATYACPPGALLPGAALLVAGTAAGALVGAGRVLATGSFRTPPQPPALSAQEIEASTPAIHAATANAIGPSALHQCVLRKLAPVSGEAEPVQWSQEQRTVSFAAVSGMGSTSLSQVDAYKSLVHDSYDYVIESFVSRIVVIPAGEPGEETSEVPARLAVEGGFRFFDLERAVEHERKLDWRSEPRTLRDWRAGDGALLGEALRTGCDALAAQIAGEAEQVWRNH